MMAATRSSNCARCSIDMRHQCSNAAEAALTARSASGIPASATSPTISLGALGLSDAIHLPVETFSPLITSGYFLPNWLRAVAQRGLHLFLDLAVDEIDSGAFS